MTTDTPADFAVHAEREGRAYVVAPRGELDLGTVDEVRSVLALRPHDCARVVIDLGGLTFFDTSGMRLIVETLEDTRRQQIELALVRGSDHVQRLFAVAQLEDRLPFFDDRDKALAGH